MKASNDDKQIHSLVRIYLRLGKPLTEVVEQLSRMKSLDHEGIESTFKSVLKRSRNVYSKKPEEYEQIVKLYTNTLKKIKKSEPLMELEERILNVKD